MACVAALIAMPAAAEPAQLPAPSPVVTQALGSRLAAGMTLDRYLQNLGAEFRQLDADGNGELGQADIVLHDAMTASTLRTTSSQRIMSADLDGDGAVSQDELRRKLRYERRTNVSTPTSASVEQQIEQEIRNLMAADADKDGRITWIEAIAFAKSRPNYAQTVASGFGSRVRQTLALAAAGKTAITLPEIEVVAGTLFRGVDTDGNGTLSQDELEAYRRQTAEQTRREAEAARIRKQAEARAGCTMPRPSEAAKVLLLSAYGSDAVSTTTIGSQDIGTGAGTIAVEPGEGPLYIVVVAYRPIIWRLAGAVERVERIVLAATMTGPNRKPNETPPVGVTGLAPDRVSFLPQSNCLHYFTEAPSSQAAIAAGHVRRETGKDPAVVAGRYQVSGFSVPSGEIRTTGRGPRPILILRKPEGTLVIQGQANVVVEAGQSDLASEVARFYPGGVVEIDPAAVVASRPPERYEVLPNQAGLLQLTQAGALGRNARGEYLIKQKIRFPAELNGAHSARFLLLRGVPVPDGDPGHSCVIVEETGYSLKREGATC